MRLPTMISALTVNILLAIFSILMAIIALGLLAFVLAKDNYSAKDVPSRINTRDKLKRHESTVVDFKNPSTIPDHFLQLNTLMFQKRLAKNNEAKNNQINANIPPVPMHNMEIMAAGANSKQSEESIESVEKTEKSSDEQFANRALPPIPGSEISSNQVTPERTRRSEVMAKMNEKESEKDGSTSPSSFVTDSGISDEDFSDGTSTVSTTRSLSTKSTSSKVSSTTSTSSSSSPESSTIEPPAQKIIVDFKCGNEFSLC
ncbi:hypothetical protein WR25_16867 isoform A [Diploscapter pachys]|uniref:Uncharacterized protein n=1 Tax=Diploscapter pachys TaxID=2018661 RepID=A0A2A2LDY2_9BILA|nr:hypothetical protein WR25_16867 isoform A [Diploscapter pachys]